MLGAAADENADAMSETTHQHEHSSAPKWKFDGVRVIPGHALDPNTAQTPGMDRKAAINAARGKSGRGP